MTNPLDRLKHHVTGAIERGDAEPIKARLPISICPAEPRANVDCDVSDSMSQDLLDCTGPGDAEPACRYVMQAYDLAFTIWDSAERKHRTATPAEIGATCRAIYFDSDSDFDDLDTCAMYLVWEVAANYEQERESYD
jgi:hypothetical protein